MRRKGGQTCDRRFEKMPVCIANRGLKFRSSAGFGTLNNETFDFAISCRVPSRHPRAFRRTNNLTGYWVFRVPRDNNDGTFQESFFELKQEGEAVTGRALKGTGENPIAEGAFHDGRLHFIVSLSGQGGGPPTQTAYEGKLGVSGKFALTGTGRDPKPTNGEFVRATKESG